MSEKNDVIRNVEEMQRFGIGSAFIDANGNIYRLRSWGRDWTSKTLQHTRPDFSVLLVSGSSTASYDFDGYPLTVVWAVEREEGGDV